LLVSDVEILKPELFYIPRGYNRAWVRFRRKQKSKEGEV
jgi:hypothetical protein